MIEHEYSLETRENLDNNIIKKNQNTNTMPIHEIRMKAQEVIKKEKKEKNNKP
jgi:hypothetical protein